MKIEETIILLEKLNQLKENGALTQEEFNNKKQELLSGQSSIILNKHKMNIANMIKSFFYKNRQIFLIIFVGIVIIFISKHIMPQYRFEKMLQKGLVGATVGGIFWLIIAILNKVRNNQDKKDKKTKSVEISNKAIYLIQKEKNNKQPSKNQDSVNCTVMDFFIPIVGILMIISLLIVAIQRHPKYAKKYQATVSIEQNVNKFQSKVDYINSEINNKIYKSKSNEELYEELKKQVKDNEITGISAYNGFVISAQVIKEYCAPTGYIPNNFIKKINNYKKNIDVENILKNEFIKLGATKEQSNILVKTMLEETKNNLSILMDRDYSEFKKEDASLSKKAYCKLYDSMADKMIQNRINIVKNTTPKAYEKYFKH